MAFQNQEILHSCFERVVNAIKPNIKSVALKAFTKKLISVQNLSEAENVWADEPTRASKLAQLILNKVEEEQSNFFVFVAILEEIPSLESLAKELLFRVGTMQEETGEWQTPLS